MKIEYYHNGNLLAHIKHSNIAEIIAPKHIARTSFEAGSKNIFIYQRFINETSLNWQVTSVTDIKGFVKIRLSSPILCKATGATRNANWLVTASIRFHTVEITLEPHRPPKSIGLTRDQSGGGIHSYIAKLSIVEVDFGTEQNSISKNGVSKRNEWQTSGNLPGELYKKRPCVVVSIDGNNIEIIPLSTSGQANDYDRILVSPQSFSKLHWRFSKDPSFALIRLKQTVSIYRVFPPLLPNSSFPKHCLALKIRKSDGKSIFDAVAMLHDSEKVKSLIDDFAILKAENEALKTEIEITASEWGLPTQPHIDLVRKMRD
jgi:hypothetical protein